MTSPQTSTEGSAVQIVNEFGFAEDLNPRFRRTMEDGHIYRDNFGPDQNLALCAIFDGHGGKETVDYLTQHFHKTFNKYLVDHPDRNEKPYAEVMKDVFAEVDKELSDQNIVDDGSTGCVVLIERSGEPGNETLQIISANCGDARTVFVQDNESYRVSRDHKPTDPREVARIKAADCFIVQGRVCGVLAVSRSFGDHTLKEAVISTPFVSTLRLTRAPQSASPSTQPDIQNRNEDVIHIGERELTTPSILIIACDGVWDVLSDEEAGDIALSHADSAQDIADALLTEAKDRMTTDNVSVMVLLLSPPASPEYLAQRNAKKEDEKRKKEEEERKAEEERRVKEEAEHQLKLEDERKRREAEETQLKNESGTRNGRDDEDSDIEYADQSSNEEEEENSREGGPQSSTPETTTNQQRENDDDALEIEYMTSPTVPGQDQKTHSSPTADEG
ncbi:putative Protein phosphatase 2C [Blattamonas nauphoetae]|uniref:PPM-type phosphatase domain-containing protein n=1 Tax=Blattamonas nauphoetae TaxID=2049346 RepID=A0ABQ9Y612_9EUKA|nr:putative Protein phosphatase 2C [Blattamonas nauphoetae]